MKRRFILLFLFPTLLLLGTENSEKFDVAQTSRLETDREISSFQPIIQPPQGRKPLYPFPKKNSALALGLSALCPGLGHTYLNEFSTADGLMGIYGLSAMISLFETPYYQNEDLRQSALINLQNTWFYGMYATYRDLRSYNGVMDYSYTMPSDSLTDLTLAPFRLAILQKPEVWGAFTLFLSAAVGLQYLHHTITHNKIPAPLFSAAQDSKIFPLAALPVGIGEEAFFRGFVQSQVSEWTSPLTGAIFSSLFFGAMHIPNATEFDKGEKIAYYALSLPLITAFGGYASYLTYKNRSLCEGVAIHFWYDFVLFTADYLFPSAAIVQPVKFVINATF